MSLISGYVLVLMFLGAHGQTPSGQKSGSRLTAERFFQTLDAKDVRKTYRTLVCDGWKQQANEEAWVSLMTPWMLQRQTAAKERTWIDEKDVPLAPGMTGGTATALRSKAVYATGSLYEDVIVYAPEKGDRCIAGFWVNPAPF